MSHNTAIMRHDAISNTSFDKSNAQPVMRPLINEKLVMQCLAGQ
jgi:hypothetical protein